jgi:hypothetical protein
MVMHDLELKSYKILPAHQKNCVAIPTVPRQLGPTSSQASVKEMRPTPAQEAPAQYWCQLNHSKIFFEPIKKQYWSREMYHQLCEKKKGGGTIKGHQATNARAHGP